jgi:hypothetical protein
VTGHQRDGLGRAGWGRALSGRTGLVDRHALPGGRGRGRAGPGRAVGKRCSVGCGRRLASATWRGGADSRCALLGRAGLGWAGPSCATRWGVVGLGRAAGVRCWAGRDGASA